MLSYSAPDMDDYELCWVFIFQHIVENYSFTSTLYVYAFLSDNEHIHTTVRLFHTLSSDTLDIVQLCPLCLLSRLHTYIQVD